MVETITEVLYRINEKQPINKELMQEAINDIVQLDIEQRDICLGEILTGLLVSEPDMQEVYGLLEAIFSIDGYIRENQPLNEAEKTVIEYIGSGKKGIKTINISTPSALIASAAGACILKKGSSATSSVTGSADFMSIIGGNQSQDLRLINKSLEEIGFAFVNIEKIIPKFDNIYNGRFLVPHILSLGLPAIVTPLRGDKVFYGLAHSNIKQAAQILNHYHIGGAIVSTKIDSVHYMDELCPIGVSKCIQVQGDNKYLFEEFNKKYIKEEMHLEELRQKSNPLENVKTVLNILCGHGSGTQKATICLNAGMLLVVGEQVKTLNEGVEKAYRALENLRGIEKLEEFLEFTKSDMDNYYKIKKESAYV